MTAFLPASLRIRPTPGLFAVLQLQFQEAHDLLDVLQQHARHRHLVPGLIERRLRSQDACA
jgi:hypothetical protein